MITNMDVDMIPQGEWVWWKEKLAKVGTLSNINI